MPMMTPEELTQYLAQLRVAFASDPTVWPETADALIALPEDAELGENDHDLLELVAHAFQRNEDMQREFPHFYQRLLRNPALREALLEILEMMEAGEDE